MFDIRYDYLFSIAKQLSGFSDSEFYSRKHAPTAYRYSIIKILHDEGASANKIANIIGINHATVLYALNVVNFALSTNTDILTKTAYNQMISVIDKPDTFISLYKLKNVLLTLNFSEETINKIVNQL